jgi:NAD(P)-dependent dehydrogenase (short-subunit alcohol dehydrogenase family)
MAGIAGCSPAAKEKLMKDFKGKVAVITGGAGGIGSAFARRWAAEGAKIVLADVEGPALKAAEEALRAGGADVRAFSIDVSNHAEVERLAEQTLSAFGGVHLLFNNAGVQAGQGTALWEDTLKDWHWVVGVNLWGVIHGVRVFVPIMSGQGGPAHIVNTASVAGLRSSPDIGIYSVTKAAVVMLSENLFQQLRARQLPIGVTVVCPGVVRTRLNDAWRNRPPDLANETTPPLTPQQEAVKRRFVETNAGGMAPDDFARIVFDAVSHDRLYCVTHHEWDDAIRERTGNILSGTNPAPPETY